MNQNWILLITYARKEKGKRAVTQRSGDDDEDKGRHQGDSLQEEEDDDDDGKSVLFVQIVNK